MLLVQVVQALPALCVGAANGSERTGFFPIAREALVADGRWPASKPVPATASRQFRLDKYSYRKLCRKEVINEHQWLRYDRLMYESIKVLRPLSFSTLICQISRSASQILRPLRCSSGSPPVLGVAYLYTFQLNGDPERIVRQVFHHISPPAD